MKKPGHSWKPISPIAWVTRIVSIAATAALVACSVPMQSFAQESAQLKLHYGVVPWTGGTNNDALGQAASGATVPMSTYVQIATKDGNPYIGVIVGGDPMIAGPAPVTLHAVVIPLVIQIVGTSVTTFDPTKANSCDGGVSAVTRFKQSPLVVARSLSFNKVVTGTDQFINGFMRAQFWAEIGGASTYSNPINWSFASAITMQFPAPGLGIVDGSGCNQVGIISQPWLDAQLQVFIPVWQAAGLISTTKLAVFLMENVVGSSATPPTTSACCIGGYHGAVGSPVQTYSPMDYDTSGRFGATHDIGIPTHEIGEWMNDPLGNNPTPAWGHIGQTSGCQGNFEVGDPLSGTNMPAITMSGYVYHPQELAFFSWFFNNKTTASVGTGGKFSAHGTFKGPSQPCPPGGTF